MLWETLTPSSVRTLRSQSAAVTVTPLGTGKRVTVSDCHSNRSSFTVVCIANWDCINRGPCIQNPVLFLRPPSNINFKTCKIADGYDVQLLEKLGLLKARSVAARTFSRSRQVGMPTSPETPPPVSPDHAVIVHNSNSASPNNEHDLAVIDHNELSSTSPSPSSSPDLGICGLRLVNYCQGPQSDVQGDPSGSSKPPADFTTKVPLWPGQNGTFVLKSTGGWELPDGSPCAFVVHSRADLRCIQCYVNPITLHAPTQNSNLLLFLWALTFVICVQPTISVHAAHIITKPLNLETSVASYSISLHLIIILRIRGQRRMDRYCSKTSRTHNEL